jgi:hypothetical protein
MTRRALNLFAILATIGLCSSRSWAAASSERSDEQIIVHRNWILKSSDIDR